jgi:hypothetical protein
MRSGFFCQNSRKNFSAFSSSNGIVVASQTSTKFALVFFFLLRAVWFLAADVVKLLRLLPLKKENISRPRDGLRDDDEEEEEEEEEPQ